MEQNYFQIQERTKRQMRRINRCAAFAILALYAACFCSFDESRHFTYPDNRPCENGFVRNDSIFCVSHNDTTFVTIKLFKDARK